MRILTLLTVLALAVVAGAQTKISGTVKCDKPSTQQSVEIGDRSNHSLAIIQSKCAWTAPYEVGGDTSKEGLNTVTDEVTSGTRSRTRGFYVDTMANGDKANVHYQGTSTLKGGKPETLEGKWTYVGGTGKLKGLKGQGTYKGKVSEDGGVTYDVEGEYTLPK